MQRFLMVKRGCDKCRPISKIVNSKINPRLPTEKTIKIIDCYEWEEFGVRNIPLMDKLEKIGLHMGYPFLFVDGIIIEPTPLPEQMQMLLERLLNKEFII